MVRAKGELGRRRYKKMREVGWGFRGVGKKTLIVRARGVRKINAPSV